jgi:glycine/D-amino acid oxidase-like deaminating enzyme
VRHDAHGWWIEEAGAPPALPPLQGALTVDVAVVGGGYTGMWAAWHLADAGAEVALVEAGRCGFGPSGRNGGFVSSLDLRADPESELAAAGRASVEAIGAWCAEQEVDAWYRTAPHWIVSTAPGQDAFLAGRADGRRVVELEGEEVRRRCASPVFRGALEVRSGATVHPARLAFGLRERLLGRGVRIHEGSRAKALRGTEVETAGGRLRAGAVVVAAGSAGAALRPLRDRLTVASSHVVLTEPVPDVIGELGWTGGEAITDARKLLHYFRTTRDGRIVFGWAGGRVGAGARTDGRMEVDPEVIGRASRDLARIFPALAGRRIERAWGGPIDVSPTHDPSIRTLSGGRAWAAFGYTGNGVGPSHLFGRVLADLALGSGTSLPVVDPPAPRLPPEPLRVAGAAVLRRALIAAEGATEQGRRAPLPLRALASVPERLGMRIVR